MRQSTAAVEMLFERHQKNGTERTGSDRTCDTYARRDEHDAEGGRERAMDADEKDVEKEEGGGGGRSREKAFSFGTRR